MVYHLVYKLRFVLTFSLFLVGFLVFYTDVALAFEQTSSPVVQELYKGSFISEERDGILYYWYVRPNEGDRYAIGNANDFSRLLRHVGVGITEKDLLRLANSTAPDYEFLFNNRGRVFIVVDGGGAAWFVNPLDMKPYYLANGQAGFTQAQALALQVHQSQLSKIPASNMPGFDHIDYSEPIILSSGLDYKDFEMYGSLLELLKNNHYYRDNFSTQDLFYGSLAGMAKGTKDPHTEFYTPDQNAAQFQQFFGELTVEGIGAVVNRKDNVLYVVSTFKDGPARRAGLRDRDQILAIDGLSTEGFSQEASVSRIKGAPGTTVVLQVYRPSEQALIAIPIVRERVHIPSVEAENKPGNIAYFKINMFTAGLVQEFDKEVKEFVNSSTKGIIIDLRNNGGGVTQTALGLADYWLSEDELIMSEQRLDASIEYRASSGRLIANAPTVILVNEETASASEIFTSALKHHKQALVVGTKTYGKGTGQSIANFEDGSGLKYTIFEWLTADGKSIEGSGVLPDYIVSNIDALTADDAQLQKAQDLIQYSFR